MLHRSLLVCGALLLVPCLGSAQDATVPEAEIRALVKALASEDAGERKRATERLESLGIPALPHLGRILGETTDPELWDLVHRILVHISGRQEGRKQGLTPWKGPHGPAEDFLQGLDERLRRIFEEFEGRLDRLPGSPGLLPPTQSQRHSQGNTVQVQIGPKGVEVKITRRDESGKEEVEHFKAKDIEEFKRLYPEVARTYGIGGEGPVLRLGPRGRPGVQGEDLENLFDRMRRLFGRERGEAPPPWTPGMPGVPPFLRQPQPGQAPEMPPGERLGVFVRELSPDLSEYLDLRPGHGLLVEEVLEGTLARRAGLKPKDIVLSVAGQQVRGSESILEALATVPGGEVVEILVLRGGREVRLKAQKDQVPESKETIKPLRRA